MDSGTRMVLALALSFVVFMTYQFFFGKPPQPPVDQQAQMEQQMQQDETMAEDENIQPIEAEQTHPAAKPVLKGRKLTVSTPLYNASFREDGAVLTHFELKKYHQGIQPDSPFQVLTDAKSSNESDLSIGFVNHRIQGLNDAVFQADTDAHNIDVSHKSKTLSFSWTSPEGYRITKIFTFYPDSYAFDLVVKIGNPFANPLEDKLTLALTYHDTFAKKSRYTFSGPSILIDNRLEELSEKDISKTKVYPGNVEWMALGDRYFMSAIIPDVESSKASVLLEHEPGEILKAFYVDPADTIPAKAERSYSYKVYMGPKSLDILSATDKKLAKAVDFGWFDIIAKPLLHALNFFNRYVHNYGIAIIILTILIKAAFWPLSNKSYKSMSEMKKLQPKMQELRQKYKGEKQKMNQELMNLYKTYNINPLGGCLPMVLQIPVFFAFYKMLYQCIELRHQPFFGWITDLSAPDRLFRFDFSVPLMDPPYGIPVLTIIMGASMFLQQKMSPPPGDPSQAKLMMILPIVFTFIFINFPSGLVLYWLVNNILSIAQQYYITKKTA
ncbi:MAG: hypothetical protein BA868_08770 [Desulfobacterales bacterium C00003106]|nr:MAG: hypothetical protein BA868_08770 [Desulfobacterales bacterium C00003106]OEU58101.1 MAG: hypothetical protein BAW33_00925 [Desulfobacterales bacterium C00003104]